MKNLAKITVLAFAAISFTFASCESKTAGNVDGTTESNVDADEAESDTTGTEGADATVQDQPVQDGLADSTNAQ